TVTLFHANHSALAGQTRPDSAGIQSFGTLTAPYLSKQHRNRRSRHTQVANLHAPYAILCQPGLHHVHRARHPHLLASSYQAGERAECFNTAKVSKGHHCAELQFATHNRRLHLLGSGRNTLHKARDQVGRSLCTAQRHIAPARTERLHLLASARSSSFGNWLIPHAAGLHAIRSEEHTSELQSRENLV